MWFRLMLLAFITNGLCGFGGRILTAWKLDEYQAIYLVFWYAAGAALVLLMFSREPHWPSISELFTGGVLGVLSLCGQTAMLKALEHIDGSVVYPVGYAGGLFIVVTVGVLFFKERIGIAGVLGIFLGISAIGLMQIPDSKPAPDTSAHPAEK